MKTSRLGEVLSICVDRRFDPQTGLIAGNLAKTQKLTGFEPLLAI